MMHLSGRHKKKKQLERNITLLQMDQCNNNFQKMWVLWTDKHCCPPPLDPPRPPMSFLYIPQIRFCCCCICSYCCFAAVCWGVVFNLSVLFSASLFQVTNVILKRNWCHNVTDARNLCHSSSRQHTNVLIGRMCVLNYVLPCDILENIHLDLFEGVIFLWQKGVIRDQIEKKCFLRVKDL